MVELVLVVVAMVIDMLLMVVLKFYFSMLSLQLQLQLECKERCVVCEWCCVMSLEERATVTVLLRYE